MPTSDLAAGCTSLMLASSASGDDIRWLAKPRGAKALVLAQLERAAIVDESDDTIASVHGRMRALRLEEGVAPPGWPRVSGPCVLLDGSPGTIHVFDCATHPLFVRLSDVCVAGLWSFGAAAGSDAALIATRQAEAALLPER